MRNPINRDNAEHIYYSLLKTTSILRKDGVYENHHKELKKFVRYISKDCHLELIRDEEIIKLFSDGLAVKKWRILKPPIGYKFWTNDNPGFSPNFNSMFNNSFYYEFKLTRDSICYFVLSPNYCIQFVPFSKNDPIEMNGLNTEIEYTVCDLHHFDQILQGVFQTKYKLLIADNEQIFNTLKITKENSD